MGTEEGEVSSGDIGTGDVSSSVSESSLELVSGLVHFADEAVNESLIATCLEEGLLEVWLVVIVVGLVEPVDFVLLLGGLGVEAVLVSEVVKDGIALVLDGAIILDVDGDGVTSAIGAGSLGGTPFLKGQSLVLEGDTLVGEEVADGLGAALDIEVDDSGHCDRYEF